LVQKTLDFSKYMVCPHGLGERGLIFRDFVRTSFMDDGYKIFQRKLKYSISLLKYNTFKTFRRTIQIIVN